MHPLALHAHLHRSPGQPTNNDVMEMEDTKCKEWHDSIDKELEALHKCKAFKIVDQSAATKCQIVPSTWALKVKTYPDGSVMKKKS